jgi:hypothetical protein
MNNSLLTIFYSYKWKIVGIACITWGIFSFVAKYLNHAIWDMNLLSGLTCWGLCFIFFSKEKTDDERIHQLKFRALAWGLPTGLLIVHMINYFFLSQAEPDSGKQIKSISAYASFTLVLLIAMSTFYYLKYKDERN